MIKMEPASFRDPDAFIFYADDIVYRQINYSYKKVYDMFMESGLYDLLSKDELIIKHMEADICLSKSDRAYKVLKPEGLPFISYPYEWCFGQLKDAALLTLEIQMLAMERGMSLKDASAYNIQYLKGKPVFIDTSSFELYDEGKPWVAYGQFCRHFFAPLLLMAYTDTRLIHLLKSFIDGIPLDLANKLLPFKMKLKPMVFMNIFLHSFYENKFQTQESKHKDVKLSKSKLYEMIKELHCFIDKLKRKGTKTQWSQYVENNSYIDTAKTSKGDIVYDFLTKASPKFLWDIGANTGDFSRIAASLGINTVSIDLDIEAVEKNYMLCKENSEKNILPLTGDILNPSPGIGWNNSERSQLTLRRKPDAILALALVHHLVISGGITLDMLAQKLNALCRHLIIEFVPPNDKMVQQMLAGKDPELYNYSSDHFERAFREYFNILERQEIDESDRVIFLMSVKKDAFLTYDNNPVG
jgi:hypothetical protein